MTALVFDIEDQIYLAWRTGMSAAEIAARFNISLAVVQSILDDVGGSAPTVPLADRHPSGDSTRRTSHHPGAFPTGRRLAASVLSFTRRLRAPLP